MPPPDVNTPGGEANSPATANVTACGGAPLAGAAPTAARQTNRASARLLLVRVLFMICLRNLDCGGQACRGCSCCVCSSQSSPVPRPFGVLGRWCNGEGGGIRPRPPSHSATLCPAATGLLPNGYRPGRADAPCGRASFVNTGAGETVLTPSACLRAVVAANHRGEACKPSSARPSARGLGRVPRIRAWLPRGGMLRFPRPRCTP